jgi:hypothetical protein
MGASKVTQRMVFADQTNSAKATPVELDRWREREKQEGFGNLDFAADTCYVSIFLSKGRGGFKNFIRRSATGMANVA